MQIVIFAHEIKWVLVVFMVQSANNYVAAEQGIAPPPAVLLPEKPTAEVPTMAIVLVCLLSAFFLICVVSAYFRYFVERQLTLAGSETGSMRSVARGLDFAVIATFASFSYSSVKEIKIGQTVLECAVCLNEFQDHETLRLLPKCSHVFHRDCVDEWLASHVTCPVCRANLVPTPGELSHVTESLSCPVEPEIDFASTEFLLTSDSKHNIPRSYSTGHSVVVQPVENVERYTLRLPNEARGLFMNSVAGLPTSPHVAFPMESSQKMNFRSISVGSTTRLGYVDYERFNHERQGGGLNHTMGRSFISTGGSSGSHVANNANELMTTSNSQSFFRSVRSPFDRFLRGSNRNIDVEERSTDKLTPDEV